MSVHVLFIDNFDSFTFNLVDEFAKRGCDVLTYRNELSVDAALRVLESLPLPRLLVVSPGPGAPADAGCSVDLCRATPADTPLFGICLGHQAIVEAFGGTVGRAEAIVHGKTSAVTHVGRGLFEGLPNPMPVARYHSLAATALPDCLEVTAKYDAIPMAVAHRERPIAGVQFHPESILTPLGGGLIENALRWAETVGATNRERHGASS